jgi:curved DNA-binding protein CbpA
MDFYVILGLERGATLNDVKRAFRRLARKYHPDINPGDRVAASHFEQISQAYETLSDPDRPPPLRHGWRGTHGAGGGVRVRGVRLFGERQRRGGANIW